MRCTLFVVAIVSTLFTGCGAPPSSSDGKQSEGDKTAGAIRAVEDSLSGKAVKAEDYGTTKEEIFVVFKAKIVQITMQVRRNPTEGGLAVAKSDSQRLLRAMELVDSNRTDTVEFRKSC